MRSTFTTLRLGEPGREDVRGAAPPPGGERGLGERALRISASADLVCALMMPTSFKLGLVADDRLRMDSLQSSATHTSLSHVLSRT